MPHVPVLGNMNKEVVMKLMGENRVKREQQYVKRYLPEAYDCTVSVDCCNCYDTENQMGYNYGDVEDLGQCRIELEQDVDIHLVVLGDCVKKEKMVEPEAAKVCVIECFVDRVNQRVQRDEKNEENQCGGGGSSVRRRMLMGDLRRGVVVVRKIDVRQLKESLNFKTILEKLF